MGLVEEVAEGAAQRILVEVARAHHVEAGRLQSLRDQAGVIGGGGERAGLVIAVADDQRDAVFRLRGVRGGEKAERQEKAERGNQFADVRHGNHRLNPVSK